MDCDRIVDFNKTVDFPFFNHVHLETSELHQKMIDLWVMCKVSPSLMRKKKAEIVNYISIAKQKTDSSLEKISKKLQKLVEGVKEETECLEIPKRLLRLPLEHKASTDYFAFIKRQIQDIAAILNISFELPTCSSNSSHSDLKAEEKDKINDLAPVQESVYTKMFQRIREEELTDLKKSLKQLEESDPQQYQAFRSFIRAACLYSLENDKIKKEVKSEKFSVAETQFNDLLSLETLYSMSKEDLKVLHQERIEHLGKVISLRNKKERKIAIIGGGPAGLIRGLLASYLGFEVKIIEKRNASYQTEGRPNFLHLGHDSLTDIAPLIYFGVFDRLIIDGTITKSEFGGFLVAICDLERAIAEVLKLLSPNALVASVDHLEIKVNEGEKTNLFYKGEGFSADLVMLCDGARSMTGKQLGLTHTVLYKKMHAPIGFFSPEETSFFQVTHRVQGLSSLLFEGAKAFIATQSLQAVHQKVQFGGVLFRKKEVDYVGVALTTEEETLIKTLSKEEKDKTVLEKLQKSHHQIDVSLSLLFPTHAVRPGRLIDHRLIPIQVKKAETPIFTMGKTLFVVRGDAHGTTHPASGYGAKTALSSLVADLQFLPFFEKAGNNPILIEMFTRLANDFLFTSQSKAARVINAYLKEYEKPVFFIERANGSSLAESFSHLDLSQISYYFYLQKQRALSSKEKENLRLLKRDLIQWCLNHAIRVPEEAIKNLKEQQKFPIPLLQKEFAQYSSFVTEEVIAAMNPFDAKNFHMGQVFHSIAIKFLFDLQQEGFGIFFGLLSAIEKILEQDLSSETSG